MYNCIIVVGPTASGKTEISISLAKQLNGEIINADCLQIYKKLNIGTAKPTLKERDGIIHHMLDFVDPADEFSVAQYRKQSMQIIKTLLDEKKTAIIVGGTGFYIQSLLSNYNYGNTEKSQSLRDELKNIKDNFGNEKLYQMLQEIDPESAKNIHPNDVKRVIRAIEIYKLSGHKKSDKNINQTCTMQNLIKPLIIAINRDRAELYNRINLRVDQMIENGLIEEVKNLVEKDNLTISNQSMQAIGYKEIIECLDGKIALEEAIDKIKINTRHYAKRQITWFRNQIEAHWINLSDISKDDAVNEILDLYKK